MTTLALSLLLIILLYAITVIYYKQRLDMADKAYKDLAKRYNKLKNNSKLWEQEEK